MKIHKAISDVLETEKELAARLHRMGEKHCADPDILHLTRTLAERCGEHLKRLAPFAERYGVAKFDPEIATPTSLADVLRRGSSKALARSEPAGMVLLTDLRDLYTAAQAAEITWVILLQGALAARDRELIDVVRTSQEEAQHRWQWVRTRIKETSPQVLAAG